MLLTKTAGAAIVTTAEAKAHMRVADTAEDAIIAALIDAATTHAEAYSGRAARANTWVMLAEDYLDMETGELTLRVADVGSITAVERLKGAVWTAVPSSVYELRQGLACSAIVEKYGQSWPMDYDTTSYPVRVTFVQARTAPLELFKAGILRHVAQMFADRGDAEAVMTAGSPDGWTRTLTVESAKQSGAEAIYASFALAGI